MGTTTNSTGIHDSRTCRAGKAKCPYCRGRGLEVDVDSISPRRTCSTCNGEGEIPAPCEMCRYANDYEWRQSSIPSPVDADLQVACARANEIEAEALPERIDVYFDGRVCGKCGSSMILNRKDCHVCARASENVSVVNSTPAIGTLRPLNAIKEEWYALALRQRVEIEVATRVNQLLLEAHMAGMAEMAGVNAPLVSDELCEGLDRIEDAVNKFVGNQESKQ